MYAMQARHAVELREAEEKGFARGVADMRKHGWLLNEERERSDLYSALFYDMEKGKTPGGD